MKSSKLLKLTILALLSTIAVVLMFLNFPVLPAYAYLKIDFSDVPALIAGLLFTPVAAVVVEGLKNVLYLIFTGAGDPVGAVSNFCAGILFVVPVTMFYHKFKGVNSLITGIIVGTISMAIGMGVLNYFVFLPVYSAIMDIEAMALPTVKWATVTAGITPFNIIKGVIVGVVFLVLFTKLRTWIERKRASFI
ncbi:ECF transporter S component [Aquibacillus koreensis]|uniref:Riboflavin transporter n=1 Tax=Aquibacillus koreensis TaxID=279446 RepID=A0A9X4AHU3_9BACI|nr:ECF transporter S component [Aquibacillus koreensis]MCT2535855.1 ECF transporter S component [Aquibacillus koreensis]MDC3420311.1 ECF transporter S component [Aquibacillus koreensis]